MRIGILSPIDLSIFIPYIKDKEQIKILKRNCIKNIAPAINTLVLAFIKKNNFVRIVTLCNENFEICNENFEIIGVSRFEKYPLKYFFGEFINSNRLRNVIENNYIDLDVIHAHWTYAYAYACRDIVNQKPVFCTVRDIAQYISKIVPIKHKVIWISKKIINNRVLKNNDIHFIANSFYTNEMIKKYYNKKLSIIENPINKLFLEKPKEDKLNNFELLTVSSSLDKRKNIFCLLKAFQLLLLDTPQAQLKIIGPPFTYQNPIIKKWEKEGFLKNVTLLGSVNHEKLKDYLDNASIFISSSLEETYGNTIIEALARKTPIIAGENSGAIPYVLKKGEFGYLCDVSQPQEIKNTIQYVFNNYVDSIKKANEGYIYIYNNNIDEIIANNHLNIYKNYF